jgi:hypothetical protein
MASLRFLLKVGMPWAHSREHAFLQQEEQRKAAEVSSSSGSSKGRGHFSTVTGNKAATGRSKEKLKRATAASHIAEDEYRLLLETEGVGAIV